MRHPATSPTTCSCGSRTTAGCAWSRSCRSSWRSTGRDWYQETLDQVEAAGGDRRRFADIDPALEKRFAEDPPAPCTVAHLADQVDHVRAVAGVDHVGLGGDYDGASVFPVGMGDVAGYPLLFDELRSRGWSEAELAQLGHGNVLRAMREMEAARG